MGDSRERVGGSWKMNLLNSVQGVTSSGQAHVLSVR